MCHIAGNSHFVALANGFPVGINNVHPHTSACNHTTQEHISTETSVHIGIDSHTVDILYRLRNDEYRAPDTTEIPVIRTSFCQIHLTVGTLLRHFHLQTVFLAAEVDTVRHIERESAEATLMQTAACLTTVDSHFGIGKHSLEHQFYLSPFPFLRKGELIFIQPLLVSDAFRFLLAVETHTILIGSKSLQFPTRRHTDFCPCTAITSISTFEVPLYHIIATMTRKILSLCFHITLRIRRQCSYQSNNQQKVFFTNHSHIVVGLYFSNCEIETFWISQMFYILKIKRRTRARFVVSASPKLTTCLPYSHHLLLHLYSDSFYHTQ